MNILNRFKCASEHHLSKMVRHAWLTPLLTIVVGLAPHASHAQAYPSKPIKIIVGPGTDLLARIVAEKMSESWSTPVLVETKPAAGGIVAGDFVAKAPADGYTLLLSSSAYTINSVLQSKMPFDLQADLKPVALLATIPIVLVVNPEWGVNSVKGLIDKAKENPGKFNYGSSGNGTPAHLTAEMFKSATQTELVHVPYKGINPAITDAIAGQVQMVFSVAPSALQIIQAGRLKAIGVMSEKRYKLLPDVPTLDEQGIKNVIYSGWNGIHVPAKTPAAVVQKLHAELSRILALAEVQAKLETAGFEPFAGSPADFESFLSRDMTQLKVLVKSGRVQVE